MAHTQGQLVRVSGAFTDSAGAATDPTTVKISVVRPDGRQITYTYLADSAVVKDSTGNYHIDLDGSVPGTWIYWWHSEGTGQAADERTFIVEAAAARDVPGRPKTLGVDYDQLQRAVGRMLGIGRDPGLWQPNERRDAADIIRSGLRRFYWPPPLPVPEHHKASPGWSWSFLKVNASLSLVSSSYSYVLPEDFGELLDGGFTFSTNEQAVAIVSDDQIGQLQSRSAATGPPKYASIRTLDDGGMTRLQAVFYPTPDQAYTVSYRYSITPNDLSPLSPYPLGGVQHAETIIEACLSACEKFLEDTEGVHEKRFLECLARSVQADMSLSQPTETDVWPLEDKAKGLGITKAYLKRLIGRQMGLGPHQAIWNHKQASEVDLALETGLRKFYAPMVLPNEKASWDWSFLCPVGRIVTSNVVHTCDLPDGFISLMGPLVFAPDSGIIYPAIQVVGEHQIRMQYQRTSASGRPTMGAIRPKPPQAGFATAYEIALWPQPDDDYEITFRYQVNPEAMPNDACLPYGGQQHAQTIIEACLAAAEELTGTVNGPHAVKFLECLVASVSNDRKLAPETLGYNRDNSDRPSHFGEPFSSWHDCDANLVTYNGNLY